MPKALRKQDADPSDILSRWAIDYLLQSTDKSLATMLDAALERKYSGNSEERFFTGGGLHVFHNFKREDDRKNLERSRSNTEFGQSRIYPHDAGYRASLHVSDRRLIRQDTEGRDGIRAARNTSDDLPTRKAGNLSIVFISSTKGKTTAARRDQRKYSLPASGIRRAVWRPLTVIFIPKSTLAEFEKFMAPYLPGFKGVTPANAQDLYESLCAGQIFAGRSGLHRNSPPSGTMAGTLPDPIPMRSTRM